MSGDNPRHARVLALLQEAELALEQAVALLETAHPDRDLLDDVHADLRYLVLKLRGRLAVPP